MEVLQRVWREGSCADVMEPKYEDVKIPGMAPSGKIDVLYIL